MFDKKLVCFYLNGFYKNVFIAFKKTLNASLSKKSDKNFAKADMLQRIIVKQKN